MSCDYEDMKNNEVSQKIYFYWREMYTNKYISLTLSL